MNKFKLFVFNLIIIGVSVVCFASFMFASFWKITLTVPLNEESVGNFVGESAESIDFSLLPDDIEFTLSIQVTPATLRNALTAKNDTEKASALINPVVSDLSGQVTVAMKKLVSAVVQMGINKAVAEIANDLGGQSGDRIKDVDLESISEVMDRAFKGELHNDEAKDEIFAIIAGKIEDMDIPEEDKASAIDAIDENLDGVFDEYFADVTDEEGYINPERTIEMIFSEFLGLEESVFSSDALAERIIAEIPKSVLNGISVMLTILVVIWIVASVAWLLLLIFTVINLLRGRGSKLWVPCTFGWIPGILLCVLPVIGLTILKKLLKDAAEIFALVSISIVSVSGIISLVGIAALIVLCILGYRRARKAVNKE